MIEDPFEGSSLKWKEGKKSDRQGVHLQFHFYW
jgi:hypothetical protein